MNLDKYQFIGIISMAALLLGCGKKTDAPKEGRPKEFSFPVETSSVEVRSVEYAIDAVGSLDAFESVQVTSRVAGAVERVRFREGDLVKAGAPLVEIEPARFSLAVESAKAALARTVASHADAERGLERRQKMSAEGVASAEEVDTFRTRRDTSVADEAAARAQLSLAELNLRDAFVRAPIDGVVQTRTVQTGQYLQPGAVLATIVRREPLLLRFKVAEVESEHVATGHPVQFRIRGAEATWTAIVKHVAAKAEPSTRMVEVVAEIDKADPTLRPGTFAEVQVPSGGAEAAVIPQTAVRPSERGFLSYVVEDGKAVERVLKLGRRTVDGLVEVVAGLRRGETLVVRGAEALSPGAAVRIASPGALSSAADSVKPVPSAEGSSSMATLPVAPPGAAPPGAATSTP
ncbi:MAG: efflux RND transporter periplasmic adaptor subunit [Deltaproteobacteria bacterium]|nr:efflux RND transporter periplasmic adaptor subunit [Deltaproteobacteria bacterium]